MKKFKSGFYGAGQQNSGFADIEETTAKTVEKYSSMSREELVDELFAQAAAARRSGELSDEKLAAFYNAVKGMLTDSQREKLDILMRALKE